MCHSNKTFEFNDNGLILLKGLNGSGKSTILKAIYFALYGICKKPYTHNTKLCSVELHFKNYTIIRTRNPTRLLIKENGFENEVAQEFINNEVIHMTPEQFTISSYVRPNSRLSLITMTPSEQLSIIESFAFGDNTHLDHKTKISNFIKKYKERLAQLQSIKDTQQTYYEREKSTLPFEEPENVEFEESVLAKLNEQMKKLQKELEELNLFDVCQIVQYDEKKKRLETYDEILKWKFEEPEDFDCLKEMREKIKTKRHVQKKVSEYEETEKQYFKELNERFEVLQKYILSEETKKEIETKIVEYNTKKSSYDKITKECSTFGCNPLNVKSILNKSIKEKENLQQKIKDDDIAILSKKVKKCPKCKTSLLIQKNEIKEFETENPECDQLPKEKRLQITRDIQTLEETIEKLTFLKTMIENEYDESFENSEHLKGALENKKRYENHMKYITEYNSVKNMIDKKMVSSTLVKIKKGIPLDNLKYEEPFSFVYNGERYNTNSELERVIKQVEDYLSKEKDILKLKKEISVIEETMKMKENSSAKHIETRKKELNNECIEIQTKINEENKKREQYNKYFYFVNKKEKVEGLKKELDETEHKLKQNEKLLEASLVLERKHMEAEIISIENVIDTINKNAKVYLDLFFEEDKIDVRCSLLKKVKKNFKFKVNTTIFYKGTDYVSYEELSQGELVKVNLAYILAMNSYFGSNILLLDEFLENLDEEIIINITNKLKEIAHNKLIIVINHNTLEGIYDSIIEIT